jgi:CRISPR-associated protein Cas1
MEIQSMHKHLNTLFITREGAYLRKDGLAVEVRIDGEAKMRVPLTNLDGIVVFGWESTASAALLGACAENDVSVSFHTPHGKFLSASRGFTSGNILLRRAQYRAADDPGATVSIARNIVAAKLHNARVAVRRALRDHSRQNASMEKQLLDAADFLQRRISRTMREPNVDEVRGQEGEGAVGYFSVFNHLITRNKDAFLFKTRSRRPPMDPVNALLSFVYTLLTHDCRSACESCGLDPQCGFLHRDRPGRPSLALDLMEEFRVMIADRAALSLINRGQLTGKDFLQHENGATLLKDDSRKTVLQHWQERKTTEIRHPFLDKKVTIGLLPFLQARLLARHLRGDIDAYPAFLFS